METKTMDTFVYIEDKYWNHYYHIIETKQKKTEYDDFYRWYNGFKWMNEWMEKNKIDLKMNEKIWNEPVKNHYRTKKVQNFYA